MRNEIVLIGPVGVEKTTVSKLLAELLSVPKVSMDGWREDQFSYEIHAHAVRTISPT
jgi:shikimate kinase